MRSETNSIAWACSSRTPPATSAANLDAFARGCASWATSRARAFPALAAELVQLKVDVIVARGTPAALAAKNATRAIPVIITC